jgi:tetratricopeptide (TPR) repeat protein
MAKVPGMKSPHDSRLLTAGLLLALAIAPAWAAKAPAKKAPVKIAQPEPAPTADGLIAQARAAQAKGNTDLAIRLAQSAIVADPAKPASYDALGDVYAASGQGDYARNYYNAALQVDPMDAAALKAIAALDRTAPQRAAQADTGKPGQP